MKKYSTREEFLKELAALDERFTNLKPELELTVRDDELGVEGYVVVSNTVAAKGGPLGRCGKGGTRITPDVTLEEIGMLARRMTLKNAAAGLPLGGAKSGLRANPDEPGFEKKYRRFASLVKPILRENGGIFGGFGFDIGARPEHPAWICDELGSRKSFTGKPLAMGGTDYDREGIAGLGVAVAAKTILEVDGVSTAGASFAVQGLGAMGAAVVRYFSETGAELEFVSDVRLGGTFRVTSKNRDALVESISHGDFQATASLLEGCEKLPLDDVLTKEVVVLFPSAIQNVIGAHNQAAVRAKYFVEGANNPCSAEASLELHARGIHIVPDFIANPGGIIAAFVEMSTEDDPRNPAAKVERAKSETRKIIAANTRELRRLTSELEVDPMKAGRFMAYSKIFGGVER